MYPQVLSGQREAAYQTGKDLAPRYETAIKLIKDIIQVNQQTAQKMYEHSQHVARRPNNPADALRGGPGLGPRASMVWPALKPRLLIPRQVVSLLPGRPAACRGFEDSAPGHAERDQRAGRCAASSLCRGPTGRTTT